MKILLANAALILLALKKEKKEILPNFKGILTVKSSIKDRMRFRVEVLKNDENLCELLKEKLEELPDIKEVNYNTLIGSLLIKYNQNNLESDLLISIIIKLLNLEEEIDKKVHGILGKEVKNINEALDRGIYEKTHGFITLEELIIISLLLGGTYQLITKPIMLPSGLTLLWWAHNYIRRSK